MAIKGVERFKKLYRFYKTAWIRTIFYNVG